LKRFTVVQLIKFSVAPLSSSALTSALRSFECTPTLTLIARFFGRNASSGNTALTIAVWVRLRENPLQGWSYFQPILHVVLP
jgi:hypothetical protein